MRKRILVLQQKYHDELGEVRTISGWKAGYYQQQIWLKGPMESGAKNIAIKSLPILQSFELDAENRLFPSGKLTPTGTLPEIDWQDIHLFCPISLPTSAMPGVTKIQTPILLTRSENLQNPYALKVDFNTWKEYVIAAPLIRLQQLSFALSASQEVLITGQPLPPIPGKNYWKNGTLLLPAGYNFEPPFLAELLNHHFQQDENSLMVFETNGSRTAIPIPFFKPAARATVRLINF